jgi:hypothetical protein
MTFLFMGYFGSVHFSTNTNTNKLNYVDIVVARIETVLF